MVRIKELIEGIERERILLFFVVLAIGFTAGLGFFTLQYAEAFSYLSSDPKVCDLCHIMNQEYDSWQSLGHHHSAKSCHPPVLGSKGSEVYFKDSRR
jgi:cytochrome c nitrite reductase small subunit